MRAAVPENLGDLDLVRAADRRLGRHHANVMLTFLELPLSRFGRRLGNGKHDGLVGRLCFGCRFLDDFERLGGGFNGVVSRVLFRVRRRGRLRDRRRFFIRRGSRWFLAAGRQRHDRGREDQETDPFQVIHKDIR